MFLQSLFLYPYLKPLDNIKKLLKTMNIFAK